VYRVGEGSAAGDDGMKLETLSSCRVLECHGGDEITAHELYTREEYLRPGPRSVFVHFFLLGVCLVFLILALSYYPSFCPLLQWGKWATPPQEEVVCSYMV
jgi:hypothetical protein